VLALEEICLEVVVPTVITPGAGKAVRKDVALQIFAKCVAHVGTRGMVVALPVELDCAGEFEPSLEMFSNGFVEERANALALGVRWRVSSSASMGWMSDDPWYSTANGAYFAQFSSNLPDFNFFNTSVWPITRTTWLSG
jgi:hypothetical protein